jgi:hypothetical protein
MLFKASSLRTSIKVVSLIGKWAEDRWKETGVYAEGSWLLLLVVDWGAEAGAGA